MCSHESGRLRNYGGMLRKCPLPPKVETIGAKIQIWMRLLSALLVLRRKPYFVCWVDSLIRHLAPFPTLWCIGTIALVKLPAF
jgi:hypothetical protein